MTAPAASAKSAAAEIASIARETGRIGDAIRVLKLCDGIHALSVAMINESVALALAIANTPLPPFPPPDEWRIAISFPPPSSELKSASKGAKRQTT